MGCSRLPCADRPHAVQTVLKCLITIHRLMRESDVTFLEEVWRMSSIWQGGYVIASLSTAWWPWNTPV